MIKTLVRFFGCTVTVWGISLIGLPAKAQAQVVFQYSTETGTGPARQSYPQTIQITNAGNQEATGVTVTFTPPKGVKVDSTCLVDHMAGGLRSYTCSVGNIAAGSSVIVAFSISSTKPLDAWVTADVACDQGATAAVPLWISFS